MMCELKVLCLILLVKYAESVYYDTFTGNPVSNATVVNMRALNLIPWCIIDIDKCDPHEPRRMDHSCNNLHLPSRGASMTPFGRMLPPMFGGDGWMRTAVSGGPLPNARAVRVAVIPDGRIASHRYTHLVTYFHVAVTGDMTSVHDTANYVSVTTTCCTPAGRIDPRCNPIEVYPDDVHLRRSGIRCLNLTTAITYSRLDCVPESAPRERINTAAPLLDLSHVYGQSGDRVLRARELDGGRLKAEMLKGKEWPPSGGPFCVNNEPPLETRCHDAATGGVNSVLGLNLFYMWFFRNHNHIARRLQEMNPCWDDNKLFYTAREINIAMHNQILYYELMPALAGAEFLIRNGAIHDTLGHVDDYDPKLMPTATIDYVTTSRWYHSLQEGRLNLYTKDGRLYNQLAVVDFTLRTGALPLNNTLEGITQGAFRQPCGTSENVVDPDVGERILGRLQLASDVIASDIMKTRDFGMPPYVHYRAACGLPVPKDFKDLLGWMDREQVEALALNYESVYDIDIQVGILAERPMPGVALGPTFACITVDQMKRWRQADRFWYENRQHPGSFSPDQLYEIRKMTVAKLLCNHAEQVDHIQPSAFIIISERNELTSCSKIQGPELEAWKDESCALKYTHKQRIHTSHSTDGDTDDWNQNPYLSYGPAMSQKQNIHNRDRLMIPWVGVVQPIEDKYKEPELYHRDRPNYTINGLPSRPSDDLLNNMHYRDRADFSTNIKSQFDVTNLRHSYLSPDIEEKTYSSLNTASSEHIQIVKRPKINKVNRNNSTEKSIINGNDTQLEASENMPLIMESDDTNNMKITDNSMTDAQSEFLKRISKKGQPGFEEFGFFAVLPKQTKLLGAETIQSVGTFAVRNITENARNYLTNLTRYIETRPRVLDYIPRF